jgi:hypothetical protein
VTTEFVIAVCDVRCRWCEPTPPPRYRCYVNDELFTERTWIWINEYLEESLQISAPPGKYRVRYELVDPEDAEISVSNLRVDCGPAMITQHGDIYIYKSKNENT